MSEALSCGDKELAKTFFVRIGLTDQYKCVCGSILSQPAACRGWEWELERFFSSAGKVFTEERASLQAGNLEAILLLKFNPDMWNVKTVSDMLEAHRQHDEAVAAAAAPLHAVGPAAAPLPAHAPLAAPAAAPAAPAPPAVPPPAPVFVAAARGSRGRRG